MCATRPNTLVLLSYLQHDERPPKCNALGAHSNTCHKWWPWAMLTDHVHLAVGSMPKESERSECDSAESMPCWQWTVQVLLRGQYWNGTVARFATLIDPLPLCIGLWTILKAVPKEMRIPMYIRFTLPRSVNLTAIANVFFGNFSPPIFFVILENEIEIDSLILNVKSSCRSPC